ncbi:adenylyl-sulfate kinase [Microbacterium sp.]|uniref:adenylyl-sulfate kinase n=1 Tax=Microbacterium sp. TaxID=51671 RepID=UPI0025FF5F57|nr:adenylyl-sulfate kinase [Microbacterium sp.]
MTEVIFIGGRSGVGKTSVAFEASHILADERIRHALIEGDNLDQAYPEPWGEGIALAERNLAAMWANYREAGYTRLLFTNTVSVLQITPLVHALGGTVRSASVLLTASDETAAERLARREIGTALEEHIERSRRAATMLDGARVDHRIPTDGRPLEEIAREMLASAGWLVAAPDAGE